MKRAKAVIVKVQLSLSTTKSSQQVLVYDKTQQYVWEGSAFPELIDAMGTSVREFFRAHLDAKGKLILDEKLKEQGW